MADEIETNKNGAKETASEKGLDVECPKCHEKFVAEGGGGFSLDRQPEMLKHLLDASFFVRRCPHCQEPVLCQFGLLVYRWSKKYCIMLEWDPKSNRLYCSHKPSLLNDDQKENFRQRIVSTYPDFREKLVVLEAGLDDNIIEVMKIAFLQHEKNEKIRQMRFDKIENGNFVFQVYFEGEPKPRMLCMPGEAYDQFLSELRGRFPEGYVREVTLQTVGEILSQKPKEAENADPRMSALVRFGEIGAKMGLLDADGITLKNVWRDLAEEISQRLFQYGSNDDLLKNGEYVQFREVLVWSALYLGLGASAELAVNPHGVKGQVVFDTMMSSGGFCCVAENAYQKLGRLATEDFQMLFREYVTRIQAFSSKVAAKTNSNIDPENRNPSEEQRMPYVRYTMWVCFAAFVCGVGAGMRLRRREERGPKVWQSDELAVRLDYQRYLNLALAQNKCPLISSLKVKNLTDAKKEGLVCRISSPDHVFRTRDVEVGPLWPSAETELGSIKLIYDVKVLRGIEDQLPGSLRVEILSGEEVVFRHECELIALAADQSHNLGAFPSFLASFVRPNCKSISLLLSDVAKEMQALTGGDASLAGYQGDRKHVYRMCAAMYCAIQKKGIAYSNPPESFNLPGQKIRMPDTVMEYKLATCLDSTILFASVMEACMLHPVLFLVHGHAFVGCFLDGKIHLPQVETRDPHVVRKFIASGDFIAIETTKVTGDTPFAEAARIAQEEDLAEDRDEAFECAIDVYAARKTGVLPLALGSASSDEGGAAEGHAVTQTGAGELHVVESVDVSQLKPTVAPTGRIAVWAQKLLDLSSKNRLLNAKSVKGALWLPCPNIARLEDWLASGREVPIRSVADAFTKKDWNDVKEKHLLASRVQEIIKAEFECGRLAVEENPRQVASILRKLYRQGRADLEETGAQTLFVAIGFLRWQDPKKRTNAKPYEAPLILVPIRIGRTATEEGVCISKRDDETVVNTTLLQFLRTQYGIDIPGLDPLPMDDAGLDVENILQIFRECVKKAKGLEVVDAAAVGQFSFGKFAMWRDLVENGEALKRNPLVGHLIDAGGIYSDGIDVFPPGDVASHLKPGELYCPVSADSSQLTAVLYSELGKSFVLFGPPGTGKSQTITNIIAHNLAIGRRVLFVAEKKAALDVVHKRLCSVGLEPFCLELHANKGDKSTVMRQFASSLKVAREAVPGGWWQAAKDLGALRDDLTSYVEALHTRYPNRLSAYDCFARSFAEDESGEVKYVDRVASDCLTQPYEEWEAQKRTLRELATELQNVRDKAAIKALAGVKDAPWGVVFERGLKESCARLATSSENVCAAFLAIARRFLLASECSTAEVERLMPMLKVFLDEGRIFTRNVWSELTPDGIRSRLDAVETRQNAKAMRMARCEELERELSGWNVEKLLALDLAAEKAAVQDAMNGGFIKKFFNEKSLVKKFAAFKTTPGESTLADLLVVLTRTESLAEARKDAASVETAGDAATGGGGDEIVALSEEIRGEIERLVQAWTAYGEDVERAREYLREDVLKANLQKVASVCAEVSASVVQLRAVLRYRPFRKAADERGVGAFADLLETGEVSAADVVRVFEDAYYAKMLIQIEEANSILPGFFAHSHEFKIRQFRQLVERYADLSKRVIFAKIAERYPDPSKFSKDESRQLGILNREINKKRGQMAVRQLLKSVGGLVSRYKPCFLMSPLSIAQFLEMDVEPFDLVIFDEASQIEVCDAIGAMARGKQVIVVGDPQQMPPTNFFGGPSEGLEGEVEDAESILVECLNVGLPKTYLNWHYRSRHESLISFSNHNYYEDELNSFPSVSDSPRLGLRFHYVTNGVYGHGVNPNEAQAVVDYVCQRVKSESYRRHPRSVGIVTFNQQQQTVIEELIDQRCAQDADVKAALYGEENGEAAAPANDEKTFFVRNLENVQGDEADVIIFSITFGPGESGHIAMNFGPLNRDGGERRLNVAVTRAREQMVVFSSMRYSDIHDDGELPRGVAGLRSFLEYAETGPGAASEGADASRARNRGLAELVAKFVEDHGYKVVRDVGDSGYKIDLAVLNPYDEREYILGIECDGSSYAKQRTVQDRDSLRQMVLERGGWKMCRVWSAEWYHDRASAEARLLKLLESIKPEPPAEAMSDDDATPAEVTVVPEAATDQAVAEAAEHQEAVEAEAAAKSDVQAPQPVKPEQTELKIGKIVQAVFPVLFAEQRITTKDIEFLVSNPAIKYFKTGGNQVLKEIVADATAEAFDDKGRKRFYDKFQLPFEGKKYLLSSQWFKAGLPNLMAWLAEHGISQERVLELCGVGVAAEPVAPAEPGAPAESAVHVEPVVPLAACPLTEAALAGVQSPHALRIDGQQLRTVTSWSDCYLSLCEKLNESDCAKFSGLPDEPLFKRFFVRAVPHRKYGDCYSSKFGANGEVRAKMIGSKSFFYMPNYVVYNLLKHYGINPQSVSVCR